MLDCDAEARLVELRHYNPMPTPAWSRRPQPAARSRGPRLVEVLDYRGIKSARRIVGDVADEVAVRGGFGDLPLAAVGHEEQGIGRLVDAVDDMLGNDRPHSED